MPVNSSNCKLNPTAIEPIHIQTLLYNWFQQVKITESTICLKENITRNTETNYSTKLRFNHALATPTYAQRCQATSLGSKNVLKKIFL